MRITFFTLLAVVTLALSGCYPKGPEYVEQLDTALGLYDKEFDFKATEANPITYYLNPKVVHMKDGVEVDGDIEEDADLIGKIKEHLDDLGYTFQLPAEIPTHTFDVLVTVHESNYTGYYWYYDWWYSWGWYYPGWGYPPYGGYPVTYNYTTGTCVINFVDPKFNIANPKAAYYVGAVSGLKEGTDAYIEARLNSGLNDLFSQAPFNK